MLIIKHQFVFKFDTVVVSLVSQTCSYYDVRDVLTFTGLLWRFSSNQPDPGVDARPHRLHNRDPHRLPSATAGGFRGIGPWFSPPGRELSRQKLQNWG